MDKELQDLIDKYVKGRLTFDEKINLEDRLKQNGSFQQYADDHVALVKAITEYGQKLELKKKLEGFHLEINESETPVESIKQEVKSIWSQGFKYTMAAASIVFITGFISTIVVNYLNRKQEESVVRPLARKLDQIGRSQKTLEKSVEASLKKENSFKGNYAGTCFMISKNGYLVTSYHIVKGADSIKIENEKFAVLNASVQFHDPANDLSILKVDTTLYSLPYMVEPSEASLAEDVFTLGYPREDVVFGDGVVSALTGYNQNPNSYQISVPVNPGNSGGPLLNSKGNLVGIISGLQTETFGAAFAIKSNVILNIVNQTDSLQTSIVLPKQNLLKGGSRVNQVKVLRDYVFMVRVYKSN